MPCEGYYEFMGQTDVYKYGARTIRCLVYEQIVYEQAVPSLNEVAACGWSPYASVLGNTHVRRLIWSAVSGQEGWDSPGDGYPSVLLPMTDLVQPTLIQQDPVSVAKHFVLWGLTLRIINDIMIQCKLRDSPIDFKLLDRLDSDFYTPPTPLYF